MDISALTNVSSNVIQSAVEKNQAAQPKEESFDSIFSNALNMVNETNDYQNSAESAEIQFALGESTSTHDLMIAQEKANIALSYTVAVRDKVLDAYKEIMNMQI